MFSPSAILPAGAGAAIAILAGCVAAGARSPRSSAGRRGWPWRSPKRTRGDDQAVRAARAVAEPSSRRHPGPAPVRQRSSRDVAPGRCAWSSTRSSPRSPTACRRAGTSPRRVSPSTGADSANLGTSHGRAPASSARRCEQQRRHRPRARSTGPPRACEAQLAAGQPVETVAFQARDRLRLLNAQLDEAVASAVEISVRPGDAAAPAASATRSSRSSTTSRPQQGLDEAGERPRVILGSTPQAPAR